MPIRRRIKNSVGHYSRAELLVREATSNDSSMPSPELLLQIADMTIKPSLYADTVGMIWKRLNDKCKNWRHIYKALVVIEACLQYGSLRFIKECRSQLPQILTLCDFVYSYDQNSNAGFLIREKSQRVAALLKDESLLKQERQTVRASRSKDRDNNLDCRLRSRSVYNPSDEYVARTEAEEREHIRMAMALSLQNSFDNSASKSDLDTKPTLLESAQKSNSTKCEDLLCLDDEPTKSGKFNSWLEMRFKRFSSLSVSDLCTPSSSLTDPAPPAVDKLSMDSSKIPLLNASMGSQKSDTLADLNGLDFDPLNRTTPANRSPLDNFGGDLVPGKTLPPLSSSTLHVHKTSADEYFESLARERAPAVPAATLGAPAVPAIGNALVAAKSSTATEKTDSQLSSMLGNHRDLVDLDNICSIQKPPPPKAGNIFGNSNVNANDITPIASMGKPSFDWETGMSLPTVQQSFLGLMNQPAPLGSQQLAKYDPTWHTLAGQAQVTDIITSAPTANRFSFAGTNPFL
ncbi:Epsin-2 [Taenia crassiceps]|uniref:Epsin-2 n=1 Tax=Taenia crassiceps TaxID=6207 RepID=A0ABR4QB09_9CEST